MPALLTSTSSSPNRSTTVPTTRAQLSGSVRSPVTVRCPAPARPSRTRSAAAPRPGRHAPPPGGRPAARLGRDGRADAATRSGHQAVAHAPRRYFRLRDDTVGGMSIRRLGGPRPLPGPRGGAAHFDGPGGSQVPDVVGRRGPRRPWSGDRQPRLGDRRRRHGRGPVVAAPAGCPSCLASSPRASSSAGA